MGAPREVYEIQMLYGIRTIDQHRLAAAGHDVRVLISYGEAGTRRTRAASPSGPANVGFVLRHAFVRDQLPGA